MIFLNLNCGIFCDLTHGGKGELIVISANNNGIHAKKDLEVKNLTLSVTCADNALKGNDSVDVIGGVITLVAKSGDGIDSNSRTSYLGIVFSGGDIVIVSTSGGNSV